MRGKQWLAATPLTRIAAQSDLFPQAGRGGEAELAAIQTAEFRLIRHHDAGVARAVARHQGEQRRRVRGVQPHAAVAAGFAVIAFTGVIPLLCLGAATVALGQVFLLGPPYAMVAGLADDGARASYLAAYGTCWGIAQTLGPVAWTHLLAIGVPVVWLTGAALCVLLTASMPFAAKAIRAFS